MPDRSRKRPRDPNQLAKLVVDIATGEAEDRPRARSTHRPRAAIGEGSSQLASKSPDQRLTLHEAMEQVLSETPAAPCQLRTSHARSTSARCTRSGTGSDVEPSQIHARAGKYPHLLAKEGEVIGTGVGIDRARYPLRGQIRCYLLP
jgi:hypothetical protein